MRSDVRTLGRFQFDGVGCVGGVAAGVGVLTTTTLPSPLNAASRAARGNLQAPGIGWSFVRKTVSQKVSTISRRRGAPLWNENACAAHRAGPLAEKRRRPASFFDSFLIAWAITEVELQNRRMRRSAPLGFVLTQPSVRLGNKQRDMLITDAADSRPGPL